MKPFKERRVAIAAFNGCMKAKRNEFCLPCVVQATGYDREVTKDRRSFPHDYTITPDTSAKVDVEELATIFEESIRTHCRSYGSSYSVIDGYEAKVKNARKNLVAYLQAPRSDTSAVELVRELALRLQQASQQLPKELSKQEGFFTRWWKNPLVDPVKDILTKTEQWLKKQGV